MLSLTATQPSLVVVGDIVEDIVVLLSGPIRHATDTPARVLRRRGGSAANVAVAAAQEGAQVSFVGAIGDDDAGALVARDMADNGVTFLPLAGSRTGTIVVLVDPETGERSMLPDRGASAEFAQVPKAALAASILHLTSYSLVGEPTRSACITAAQQVRSHGGIVSVDASSAGIIDDAGSQVLLDTWRQCAPHIIFANEAEAAAVGLDCSESVLPAQVVVIKHGARPSEIRLRGGEQFFVDVPAVDNVLDLTGAGDAFAGGFLATLDPQRVNDVEHVRDCITAAHARAGVAIQRIGAL